MFLGVDKLMIKYVGSSGNPSTLQLYEKDNSNNFTPTSDNTFQNGKAYYVALGKYIVEAKYNYPKLWSKDSGRNLAGKQSGTLIGIFPKIVLQFRRLNKNELQLLVPILDNSRQTIYYYDPLKKAMTLLETYSGDYEVINKSIINSNHKNEGFSISFIAVERRS